MSGWHIEKRISLGSLVAAIVLMGTILAAFFNLQKADAVHDEQIGQLQRELSAIHNSLSRIETHLLSRRHRAELLGDE